MEKYADDREYVKHKEFVPVSRGPSDVERPAQPGAPAKTDSGAEAAVEDQVSGSRGTP